MNLDEFKKTLTEKSKWRKDHPVQATCISLFDFFRYTIPRVLDDWKYSIIYAKDRAFRGYDDRMIFSYYSENTELAINALTWLRNHRMGSPMTCKHKRTTCKCNPHKSWDNILDQMIAGFKAQLEIEDMYLKNYDSKKAAAEMKRLQKIWEKGMALYTKHYQGLWD